MIFVHLPKLKVVLLQSIYKFFVALTAVNIVIFSAIGRIFYAILGLYKIYIPCSITYHITMVVYPLVLDIFLKVYINIQYEKLSKSGFFYKLFRNGFVLAYKLQQKNLYKIRRPS